MKTPQIIKAADFETRESLDSFVSNLVSIAGYKIAGTYEELKTLSLSEQTKVFGIPCVIKKKH